ncbi:MAG: hypothetical protein ACREQ5_00345 [Candidatus Dormibacteria bacterium]
MINVDSFNIWDGDDDLDPNDPPFEDSVYTELSASGVTAPVDREPDPAGCTRTGAGHGR